MVTGSISEEIAVAVPAERLWKVAFADAKSSAQLFAKACAGLIDALEIDGDGTSPGTISTMKFNPSLGDVKPLKSRVVAFDGAAKAVKMEVLEGGKYKEHLKSQVTEMKVEAAGDGACVVKVKVEYESLDGGAALPAEDEAMLAKYNAQLFKMIETYLLAHPDEFA